MNRFSSLGWMAVVVTLTLVAFGGLAAADPPLPPSDGSGASESWTAAPSIQSCMTGFDQASSELQYCDDLHVHRKTKQIVGCTQGGDSGEEGTFDNPNPWSNAGRNHNCWNFDPSHETVTRTYLVCGDGVDGEENGHRVSNSISNPVLDDEAVNEMSNTETSQVSQDWSCPGIKPLSERHEQGELETGFGLSGAGYESLDSLYFEAGSNMSFRKTVVIPACVNRVPMTRLNVELDNQDGQTVSEKTSISASHMNMYYGPEGDNRGALREVQLPEQEAFLRTYDPSAELKSYRMWAWRQRFAGALTETVEQKDLSLPDNVDVSQLADEYSDSGVSVGDLWLTSDFLFGAQAPDESGQPQIVTREIEGQCTVSVDDFDQFDDVSDLDSFVSNNPEEAKDLLGKDDGNNYCDLGPNETIAELGDVEDSGAFEEESEDVDGTVSTRMFENVSAVETATVNVTELDSEATNASEFVDLYNNDPEAATQDVSDGRDQLDIDHIDVAQITGLDAVTEVNDDEVDVDVSYTRWPTGSEVADRDQDELYSTIESTLLDGEGFLSDGGISPEDEFEDRAIEDVHGVEAGEDTFEATMTFGTMIVTRESYQAYVDMTTVLEEKKRNSWNWRALQEVSMTDLARCMYNWDECFTNTRDIDANWDGNEIYDAGFGPRVGTFTYQWSQDAVEDSTEELRENYDVDTSATFDKYYDGAAGVETTDMMDVKVYRPCEEGTGWLNSETSDTLYEDNQFICPTEESTAYYCEYSASNLPGYVQTAEEGDYHEIDGTYYVCEDDGSVPSWTQYRQCEEGEGWLNDDMADSLYEDAQFICPTEESTAYYCDGSADDLPGYFESAEVGDYYEIGTDYYVCSDDGAVSTWTLDDTAPEISCDDCIDPSEAPIGSEVTVDFDVESQGTPMDRAAVCWDENCQEVIFEGTSGSFTVDEPTDATIWAEVEDVGGNVNTLELGSLRVARAVGESCEADEQCLSGNCQDFECESDQGPIIDIF